MVLDSTRYAIERSARVLRGMTFWGKIRNAFSDDPQVWVCVSVCGLFFGVLCVHLLAHDRDHDRPQLSREPSTAITK